MADSFLGPVTVVEFGNRPAVGLCGGLLQRLGANVIVANAAPASKQHHRALLDAGKTALKIQLDDARNTETLLALLARADVVVVSSDCGPRSEALESALAAVPVLCDVTAFGDSGPCAGHAYTDAMMQAFAGLMDTTGSAEGPPTATQIPLTECGAAVFAAAGILCALRAERGPGTPQHVSVAMFDVAVSLLSTFLPAHFAGIAPQRIGNRHPSMSPWNAYPALDGWVLLCSASNEMWKRVCRVIGRDELAQDARFATMPGRVCHANEADAVMLPWISKHTVSDCVEAFTAAGVPCGPVYTIRDMLADANLVSRGAFVRLKDPASGRNITVPGPLIKGSRAHGAAPLDNPSADRAVRTVDESAACAEPRPTAQASAPGGAGVLSGIRVLEMGSYTTAPLAARNLGALGAYVVKLEPPAGELSRASPPHVDGQSYFCTLSNSDKRCVAVDLQTDEGKSLFARLLAKADVFVENMKPGALARFGFSCERIEEINPALVYCSVSGFGAGSPLAARPAMDSTIQGMAGIMDLTRQDGVPYKVGVSISDIAGGQFALLAVLAGLAYRDRTGKGQLIDLSMQDVSAWLTQFAWNSPSGLEPAGRAVECSDGYVYLVDSNAQTDDARACAGMTKAAAAAFFASRGRLCVPVNSVSEVAVHAQTLARELIVQRPSRDGKTWPLLACPIRLAPFAPRVRRAIGAVGADLDEVLRDWGVAGIADTAAA